MPEIATAFVRIRPTLANPEREALQALGEQCQALADAIDRFLSQFATPPEIEEAHD